MSEIFTVKLTQKRISPAKNNFHKNKKLEKIRNI